MADKALWSSWMMTLEEELQAGKGNPDPEYVSIPMTVNLCPLHDEEVQCTQLPPGGWQLPLGSGTMSGPQRWSLLLVDQVLISSLSQVCLDEGQPRLMSPCIASTLSQWLLCSHAHGTSIGGPWEKRLCGKCHFLHLIIWGLIHSGFPLCNHVRGPATNLFPRPSHHWPSVLFLPPS